MSRPARSVWDGSRATLPAWTTQKASTVWPAELGTPYDCDPHDGGAVIPRCCAVVFTGTCILPMSCYSEVLSGRLFGFTHVPIQTARAVDSPSHPAKNSDADHLRWSQRQKDHDLR